MSRKKAYECGDLDGLDPNNELRSWLVQNNYIRFGSTRGAPYTHLFLNGGAALIPDDKASIFLELMAAELESGRKWSVHEQATRFARLYFDFDIEEENYAPNTETELSQIRKWATAVQSAVLDFFPGARVHSKDPNKISATGGQVIVLAAPVGYVTRKAKNSGNGSGSGSNRGSGGSGGNGGGGSSGAAKRSSLSSSSSSRMAKDSQRLAIVQRVSSGIMPSQASVLAQIGKESAADDKVMRKTGLHLIFPNIVCDLNQMLDVRAHVVDVLQTKFDAPGDEKWSKIVDVQVYSHSCGIRMPGTCKVETCKECNGNSKRKLKCNECNGRPRQFVDRAYKPVLMLTTTGTPNKRALRSVQNSTELMLKYCTIRQVDALATRPTFVAPPNFRPWSGTRVVYEVEVPSKNNSSWTNAKLSRTKGGGGNGNRSRKQSRGARGSEKVQCGGAGSGNVVAYYGPEHEISGMVERFIQQCTYPCWATLQVSEVKHVLLAANARFKQPASIYLVKVSGDNARHCLNVGREHSSSSIYFVIKKDGIDQRCWSGKQTVDGRVTGVPCRDFRSNTCEFLQYKLGRDLIRRLFPDTIESNVSLQRHGGIDSIVRVEHHADDVDSYPSLADVRKHTERKRRAVGLDASPGAELDNDPDGGAGALTPPPNERLFKRPRSFGSSDVATRVSSTQKTPHETLRMRRLEEQSPSFREIDVVRRSFVPDYDLSTLPIDMIANTEKGSGGRVAPKLQENSAALRKERETIVTFPGRDPPKDMEEYKRAIRRSQDEISAVARFQIDQFLAK